MYIVVVGMYFSTLMNTNQMKNNKEPPLCIPMKILRNAEQQSAKASPGRYERDNELDMTLNAHKYES